MTIYKILWTDVLWAMTLHKIELTQGINTMDLCNNFENNA